MEAATLCKKRTNKHLELQETEARMHTTRFQKTKHACIVEAHESTRQCLEPCLPKNHEDHILQTEDTTQLTETPRKFTLLHRWALWQLSATNSLYGTRDAAQNWEGELASTLSDFKLTRESACPCLWQGCINGEHIVATVLERRHHDRWRTIGGGTLHQNDITNIRDQEAGDWRRRRL